MIKSFAKNISDLRPVTAACRFMALLVITIAVCGPSAAQTIAVKYVLDAQTLVIDLPKSIADKVETLPTWLVRDGTTSTFTAQLPALDASTADRGAGETGAYVFGLLDWLPALADQAPKSISLQTSLPYRGVATGEFATETNSGDTYLATFDITGDWRETSVFFGPYVIGEDVLDLQTGPVRIRTYFMEKDQALSPSYLTATKGFLDDYSEQIGPYPFRSFSVVSAPIPVGLGFDGLAYVSEQILGHSYMLGRSLAHEVLHSWWGSGVGIDYETGNWAEGLTTYQADYALAEASGAERAQSMRLAWLAALSDLPEDADQPLKLFKSSSKNGGQAVGYGKAAMVFHSLRQALGDAVFEQALRQFWSDNRGEKASWKHLQNAFEAASGQDLEKTFSQWIDRTGLPFARIANAQATKTKTGYALTVRLDQTAPYQLNLPIRIVTENGPVMRLLESDGTAAAHVFELQDKPLSLSLDPEFNELRQLHEEEQPLTINEVRAAERIALWTQEIDTADAEDFIDMLMGAPEYSEVVVDSINPDVGAVVVFGTPPEIAEIRKAYFAVPQTARLREAETRAWVEKDETGRFWLFITANDVQVALKDAFSTLRFYGNQSYVLFHPDKPASFGRWPVDSPSFTVNID